MINDNIKTKKGKFFDDMKKGKNADIKNNENDNSVENSSQREENKTKHKRKTKK